MIVATATWDAHGTSRAQEAAGAPEPGPGAADLLRAVPFDRITLTDGTVLVVEPVSPRPLPVYNPTEERARRKRAIENNPAKPFEIGRAGEPTKLVDPDAEKDQSEDEVQS